MFPPETRLHATAARCSSCCLGIADWCGTTRRQNSRTSYNFCALQAPGKPASSNRHLYKPAVGRMFRNWGCRLSKKELPP